MTVKESFNATDDQQKSWLLNGLHSVYSRAFSLFIGIALAVFILIWPQHIARDLDQLEHGTLSLLMAFMCLLYVHGVGLRFQHQVMLWLLSPVVLWPAVVVLFFMVVRT